MIQYEVKPLDLTCDRTNPAFEDLVTKVGFRLTATNIDTQSTTFCNYIFEIPLASDTTFTPFNELTEEQVVSWIETHPQFEDYKHFINEKLELIDNPVIVEKPLPWVKPIEPSITEEEIQAAEVARQQFNEEFIRAMVYQVLEEIEDSKV